MKNIANCFPGSSTDTYMRRNNSQVLVTVREVACTWPGIIHLVVAVSTIMIVILLIYSHPPPKVSYLAVTSKLAFWVGTQAQQGNQLLSTVKPRGYTPLTTDRQGK